MGEGGSTAYELHKLGYAVFVLRYRTFLDLGSNAPLQDLARAVQLVTSLDEELSIQTQDYALVGYSSGGQLRVCLRTRSAATAITALQDPVRCCWVIQL